MYLAYMNHEQALTLKVNWLRNPLLLSQSTHDPHQPRTTKLDKIPSWHLEEVGSLKWQAPLLRIVLVRVRALVAFSSIQR